VRWEKSHASIEIEDRVDFIGTLLPFNPTTKSDLLGAPNLKVKKPEKIARVRMASDSAWHEASC
jgi:hypothetical protein